MNNGIEMHIMMATGEGCFHKGHYLYGFDYISSSLSAIENPNWHFSDCDDDIPGFPYENADIFWMGSCQLFSLALSRELNLCAYELLGKNNRLIHAFCISAFENQRAYIDVRGVTTNIKEFWNRFTVFPDEQIRMVLQDTEKEYNSLTEDERIGYNFALWVVHKYRGYYTVE